MEHKRSVISSRGRRASGNISLSGIAARIPLPAALSGTVSYGLLLAACFLMALALAQSKFSITPSLGVAFTAAAACAPMWSGRRYTPTAALLGTMAGYALALDTLSALKYSSAAVLAFSAGVILRDSPMCRKKWFAPVCAGAGIAAADVIYILTQFPDPAQTIVYGAEVMAAAAAAYGYTPAVERLRDPRRARSERPPNSLNGGRGEITAAQAMVCVSVICASAGTKLFAGMVLGRVLGLYMTLFAAAYGSFAGCTVGFCVGALLDMAVIGAPGMTVIYAAAGIFAGSFKKPGTFWQIIAFTLAHAALLPWIWRDAPVSVIYECFTAGVVFFLTVKAFENRGAELPWRKKAFSASHISDSAAQTQLYRLTEAFAEVGEALSRKSHKIAMTAPNGMYTLAVERVCRGCVREKMCWQKDYGNTRAALNDAAEKIRSAGRASAQDFPPYFSARCAELGEFVNNVNEYMALKESRMRYRQRVENDMRMLCSQYDAVTQVLEEVTDGFESHEEDAEQENRELRQLLSKKGIAVNTRVSKIEGRYSVFIRTAAGVSRDVLNAVEDLSSASLGRLMRASPVDSDQGVTLRETEAFEAVIGLGTNTRRGEEENGDCFTHFRADDGSLYLVMSDGMGSGGGAARESAGLVNLLRNFLMSGVSVKGALRLLSPAYTIKNEGENFATCDVLKADLYTGTAELWKCGAAPTYICSSEGKVRRIASSSMPVGLPSPEPDADHICVELKDGDMAVMVTDGVSEGEDGWIRSFIEENRFMRPSELAGAVINAASERRNDDDMSVMVLKLSAKRS